MSAPKSDRRLEAETVASLGVVFVQRTQHAIATTDLPHNADPAALLHTLTQEDVFQDMTAEEVADLEGMTYVPLQILDRRRPDDLRRIRALLAVAAQAVVAHRPQRSVIQAVLDHPAFPAPAPEPETESTEEYEEGDEEEEEEQEAAPPPRTKPKGKRKVTVEFQGGEKTAPPADGSAAPATAARDESDPDLPPKDAPERVRRPPHYPKPVEYSERAWPAEGVWK